MATTREYFRTPPVVKNLMIVNLIVFFVEVIFQRQLGGTTSITTNNPMVLYGSLQFVADGSLLWYLSHSYQVVTYMFLHGDIGHIFSNMFTLWMFGRIIEYDMGSRRFLTYYLMCGIGAGLIQLGINWMEYAWFGGPGMALTLGASGAVFGLLLAFAMFRPNNVIMLLFPPIPMKAKWFVIIYGLFELSAGVRGTGGNVAHFAHLGGMLVGFLLLRYWKKKGTIRY